MKKSFKIIYSVIFFVVLCIPLALMPFLKSDEQIEKRELTAMPSFISEGSFNTSFSDQFESFLNDRIPFRSQLLAVTGLIKGELFHNATSNVIVGNDSWLFYEEESPDYLDTNAFTDNQVKAFAVTLSLIEERVESQGGRFLFVPVPNKSSVYEEYMPANYVRADVNNLTRVTEAMPQYGVSFLDMRQVLRDHKDSDPAIYHTRDSHWNYIGAQIGYVAIMDAIGTPHDDFSNATYTTRCDWRGDVDKLLYPTGGYMDYQYYYDIEHDNFRFMLPRGVTDQQAQLENFMSDLEQGDDNIVTSNPQASSDRTLYMIRDSFGRAILPYMIDSYTAATFKRTDIPDVNAAPEGCDFIYEIAERNLIRVIAKAPFMYAPARDDSALPANLAAAGTVETMVNNEGYGIKIYGALDRDLDMGDGRVHVRIYSDDASYLFEAFPICEDVLLTEDVNSGRNTTYGTEGLDGTAGFSALIAPDALAKGDYRIEIITGSSVFDGGTITVS
ncbi:MAG: hypothetical protein K5745_04165 [Saccharofermentans sp.]|nr:hypothetical protein [Saccharofermentans sp.]